MINKAIILAGGRGTRMLPYTKACAKEMLLLANKPALHYIVTEAVSAGISKILMVISPYKPEIEKYFSKDKALDCELSKVNKSHLVTELSDLLNCVDIEFAIQKEANGTGGALLLAENFAHGDDVLVLNGDDVMTGEVSKQLVKCYNDLGKTVIGVAKVDDDEIKNCGSVRITNKTERLLNIDAIIEKPRCGEQYSNYATQGRYVLAGQIFDYLKKVNNKNGEILLTDAIDLLARNEGIYGYVYEGRRYDMGSISGYLEAQIEFLLNDAKYKEEITKILNKNRG